MYYIGQVVFVVLNKKHQIYPMQIVETVTKKTLKGEEVNYYLQDGSDKNTTVLLNEVDGEIFTSAESAKTTLIDRATIQITKLVESAEKKSKEWYSETQVQEVHELDFKEPEISFIEHDTVILPDGNVAKVKLTVNKTG